MIAPGVPKDKAITVQRVTAAGAPAYLLVPEGAEGCAVVLHGYGGCKEEVLGLGLAVAAAGFTACVPDLPGHGEHLETLTGESIERFTANVKNAGFVAAVGHSLGGRMALALGIKPLCLLSVPLQARFDGRKSELLRVLRARRVREPKPFAGLEEALAALGDSRPGPPVLLLHAARDLPTCLEAAVRAKDAGWTVIAVRGIGHTDIISAPEAVAAVTAWFKGVD
ncbi:alpha/beta hydrolase [Candidatus Desulforudis audaxviator]|uniref:AB hydrolase-1 domain-containing protein n=1 Tax=Desulforudis audaxviator (strain MP104C) TaxID=477974 RepID=B1I4G2_DESAP|nr:alpha/beta fold hydrolase [Candidatus Desulforudis audaxviator]ACA59839.1 conserved hypothetical protein [Candidatus Desulforudis audaxviator MP104C]AZK59843.1 hypothetical protein Daudx_1296 [Candidatus Desulforudis audaxviator]